MSLGNHDVNGRLNDDDDDYVAKLLAQDARNSSLKYSAVGMQAYMPKRPTTGAPKPNTRFLKNIIRSTDSHNAALKRKEEEEARERRRQQRTGKSRDLRPDRDDRDDERAKRRRVEERPGRSRERESEKDRRSRDSDDENERRRRRRRKHGSGEREAKASGTSYTESRTKERSERRHHSARHKDKDHDDRATKRSKKDDEIDHHSRHHSRHRLRSCSRSQSRSPERSKRRRRDKDDDDHYRSRRRPHRSSTSRSVSRDRQRSKHQTGSSNTIQEHDKEKIPSSPDSDPLSNLIGPLPPSANGHEAPIRSRGRGAYKPSTMDSHFAENYDPTLDVHPDDDENDPGPSGKNTRRPVPGLATEDDDWDMALEALRDRAVWRRKGADRLREAGFGDDVVNKWTDNGAFSGLNGGDKEKGIDDVRWTKKGEGREWDRGKVIDEDGHIDVKAAW